MEKIHLSCSKSLLLKEQTINFAKQYSVYRYHVVSPEILDPGR